MSLDHRLRSARLAPEEPSIDLDAMLLEAIRAGRRRRRAWRATTVGAVVLILALVSIPIVRNLSRQETDVADRIQKESKKEHKSPAPTARDAPGSRSRSDSSSVGLGVDGRESIGTTDAKRSSAGDSTRSAPGLIAFVSAEPTTEIRTMNLDGSGKKVLGPGSDPDWSPDGAQIAYSRGRTSAGCSATTSRVDPPDPCEVWLMNADGSGQRRLAAGWAPDWSPDGKRIAYGAGQDRSEIHVMNADGSGSVRITDTPNTSPSTQGANSPSWSPDGTRIAFSRRSKCGEPCWTNYLYVVRSDGTGLKPVAMVTESVLPAWSGDGRRIAFVGQVDNNAEIFTVDVDDEEIHRLTKDGRTERPLDNYDGHPAWSPDGRIAFVSDPDGPTGAGSCGFSGTDGGCGTGGPAPPRLSLMNADGSGFVDLGEGRMPDFAPRL